MKQFFEGRTLLAATVLIVAPLAGQSLSSQDRDFIQKASTGGMMEVQMGQKATQMGASSAVKTYGQKLIDDHTKANAELSGIARQKNVTVSTDPMPSMPMGLDSKSGKDFDVAYKKSMIEDHEKDIKMFEKEAQLGQDQDVKNFAKKTLPTLRQHLAQAKSLP